jgi:hypothetical protein
MASVNIRVRKRFCFQIKLITIAISAIVFLDTPIDHGALAQMPEFRDVSKSLQRYRNGRTCEPGARVPT